MVSSSTSSLSQASSSALIEEIRLGFREQPRRLSPQFLYDALGSALFDAICRLPWYRITRSEMALLQRHAADMVAAWPRNTRLIELGPGNGEKAEYLVEAMVKRTGRARVELVDISAAALESARARLTAGRDVEVGLHEAPYESGLAEAAAKVSGDDPMLVLFLGSNLGNFSQAQATHFLEEVRSRLRPGDGLLLGVDLVKEERELVQAYDDPLGVTAAFNKNVLVRINRELGADFELQGFSHRALWNAQASRVEMHLVSQRHQDVSISAAQMTVSFSPGEYIWTESSYKFTIGDLDELLGAAGFRRDRLWHDRSAGFMDVLYLAV